MQYKDYQLEEITPSVTGVKSCNIYYQLEEIMTLVIGVKSYILTQLTGRNYAISYWRKILQYIDYWLEEITPLVTVIK